MSKLISTLLKANEPQFSYLIKDFEQAAGKPSIDVRLTAEIVASIKQKIRILQLDPDDTTLPELYEALIAKFICDDQLLEIQLQLDGKDLPGKMTKIAKTVNELPISRDIWAVKKSVIRRLLKNHAPTKTMKVLHYKSIDSLVKRENILEFYAAMIIIEDDKWLRSWHKALSSLGTSAFESRPVEIVVLELSKWKNTIDLLNKQGRVVYSAPEAGVICLTPIELPREAGASLFVLSSLLHELSELRIFSSFCKQLYIQDNFTSQFQRLLNNSVSHIVSLAGHDIPWRHLHYYYGQIAGSHPSFFEPHIQPDDLKWDSVEASLQFVEKNLFFWQGSHYLGAKGSRNNVSLHVVDVGLNTVFRRQFGKNATYHLQASLWNELVARYLGEEALERAVNRQLASLPMFEEALVL
jgi:hypothetical protein